MMHGQLWILWSWYVAYMHCMQPMCWRQRGRSSRHFLCSRRRMWIPVKIWEHMQHPWHRSCPHWQVWWSSMEWFLWSILMWSALWAFTGLWWWRWSEPWSGMEFRPEMQRKNISKRIFDIDFFLTRWDNMRGGKCLISCIANKEKNFILLSLVGKRDFFQRKSKDILKEKRYSKTWEKLI